MVVGMAWCVDCLQCCSFGFVNLPVLNMLKAGGIRGITIETFGLAIIGSSHYHGGDVYREYEICWSLLLPVEYSVTAADIRLLLLQYLLYYTELIKLMHITTVFT
ncbi:hypothetical protein BDEG_24158 [Batrachochytrium dendrobatidis JEL423]|uniref:Uncharacterized protein n=1 Tax=Batrachochytrium dendrobatidis (strain JEL423) TaxID=403673 RepID=A0A177WJV8_BATDL|nr:hypothetical protein BDEG_24158 [Batrachochytrium dendrobatidis JEL423]